MRIHDDKREDGGTVWITGADGTARVEYTRSNPDAPLSLWCAVERNSNSRIALAAVGALVERETPTVLVLQSDNTGTRYAPKLGGLFRCWTQGDQSVLAEAFAARDTFNRICSLSYAMQRNDFVRVEGEDLNLYGYHSVLSKIREQIKPFQFLAIKEECDYGMRRASSRCVDTTANAALAAVSSVPARMRGQFEQALRSISEKQTHERGYDTRYSYIQELTAAVLLPAVVRLGGDHPFTTAVFRAFTETTGEYVQACEQVLTEWREIDTEDL